MKHPNCYSGTEELCEGFKEQFDELALARVMLSEGRYLMECVRIAEWSSPGVKKRMQIAIEDWLTKTAELAHR